MNEQIILVTGASRGIGAAILDTLGETGAIVIGTSTSAAGADMITNTIKQAGHTGCGLVLDVANSESVETCINNISEQYGDVSILVNNAGITRDSLLMRMKEADWSDVINTNLTSIYRLSKVVLRPMMKKRFGRIINISSVVGISGNAGQANYGAAKAGVIGFSKSLAREVASRGITVNTIAPGFIETDMTRALDDAQRDALLANIPTGTLGQVEDIAHAVKFLASKDAGYITGETLHINGGMYMN